MTETIQGDRAPELEHLRGEEHLTRRLCHALDTAARAIRTLAANGYVDSEERDNNVRPEKLISETAVLLRAAATVASNQDIRARVEHLSNLLIPFARSERMALGICLQPSLAMDYAQAHVCLTRLGYPDERFDGLLQQAASSQARDGSERVPHRALERDWIRRVWQGPGSSVGVPAAAYDSVLNRPMDLLQGSRDDVYGFTHALMYLKDFNQLPLPLPRSRAAILAEAEAALGRCLDEEDYDLGGEVLLTWPLTGNHWNASSIFGFRVLMSVDDQAGFLPAPITRLERLRKLTGEARNCYWLATTYHTIYVMGLLCAVALQPGRRPTSDAASAPGNGHARTILSYLDRDGKTPHWRQEVESMAEAERDSISGLLLAIALYRKTKQRDFGAVHQLLELSDQLGMSGTPVCSQAAELLERVAAYALLAKGAEVPRGGSEGIS